MKAFDLRQKSKTELQDLLQGKRTQAEELKFLLGQKKVKNVRELVEIKKDIARILTLLKGK